ncbi:MAG: hypothetical protein A2Z96_01260 [Spirochaetes bacterium GWB1_48_6]|nr:MAG: hypothetical protein A2Z96_01260 [Spirochaetes bacterium GWB1_48_6]
MNQKLTEELLSKVLSEGLKLDLTDSNLKDTPRRIAKMYCEEVFSSLTKPPPELTTFPNEGISEMILLDNIPYVSWCEHHFIAFSGRAFFAYIPNERIVGASKVARLIDYYSKRPQIQERLTQSIIDHFCYRIKPLGAMLVMRGIHGCMSHRGVKTGDEAGMITSALFGSFKLPEVRAEGMALIQMSLVDRKG